MEDLRQFGFGSLDANKNLVPSGEYWEMRKNEKKGNYEWLREKEKRKEKIGSNMTYRKINMNEGMNGWMNGKMEW